MDVFLSEVKDLKKQVNRIVRFFTAFRMTLNENVFSSAWTDSANNPEKIYRILPNGLREICIPNTIAGPVEDTGGTRDFSSIFAAY